jgi:hypothetical protein
MESITKITVRLPATLHDRLRRRAREKDTSLNQVLIEAVQRGLDSEPPTEALPEREQIVKILKESGLYEPLGPGWNKFISGPIPSHEELRRLVGELVPPLSQTIIEDRGPR